MRSCPKIYILWNHHYVVCQCLLAQNVTVTYKQSLVAGLGWATFGLFCKTSSEEYESKRLVSSWKGGQPHPPPALTDLTWNSSFTEGYCLPWNTSVSCGLWPHCFVLSFLRFCIAFKNTLCTVSITFELLVDVGNTGSICHPARPGFTCWLGISRNANDGRAATAV